ncbi:MAG: NAD(+)/NADH kinase [Desulfuromonadales bacterium]|nr:NAD(+)/NADH kinase [Desulfuromonadales bacterium]
MHCKIVAIFAKTHDPRCQDVANELITWLERRNHIHLIEKSLAHHLKRSDGMTREEMLIQAEVVVVLGGDGTLLSVARLFYGKDIPILGINLGSLGFLAEVTVEELYTELERCLDGAYNISPRMMLEVTVIREGKAIKKCPVLNEIVINRVGVLARIVNLKTKIDQHTLTNFKADGLIIATPTGSTGYSMSAGGPVIHSQVNCIVITPICPHTLTSRPIVVTDHSIISIIVTSSLDDKVCLTLDGQIGFDLLEGDTVEVRKAPTCTNLAVPKNCDYFEVLRTKLKWGEC